MSGKFVRCRLLTLLLPGVLSVFGQGCGPAPLPPQGAGDSPAVTANDLQSGVPLEDGFLPIRFSDCRIHPEEASNWTSSGIQISSTGKPKSYLHTTTEFANFTLRYESRFPAPPKDPAKAPLANTGVLLFIQPPHAIWPKALEVQGKHSEIGSLRPNGGAAEAVVREEPGVRDAARLPVGEWNALEVVARNGALTVFLNGRKLLESDAGELRSGMIGFQSEGHAVDFRNVRIRVDRD